MPQVSDKDLQEINKTLERALEEQKHNTKFVELLTTSLNGLLGPFIQEMKFVVSQMRLPDVKVPDVYVPEIKLPIINIPEIKVPDIHVTVPDIKAPNVIVPEIKVPVVNVPPLEQPEIIVKVPSIRVPRPHVTVKLPKNLELTRGLKEIKDAISKQEIVFPEPVRHTFSKPLPVILTDDKGKPYIASMGGGTRTIAQMLKNEGGLIASFGLGASNTALRVVNASDAATSVTVSGFTSTLGVNILNSDGATIDPRLVNVVDAFGSTAVNGVFNADNRVRVSLETGSSGLTDAELRATSVAISQVSGATDSTNVAQLGGNAIDTNVGDVGAGTQRIYLVRSANSTTAAVAVGSDASTNIVPTSLGRKSVTFVHNSSNNLYLSTGTASSASTFPIVANQIVGFDEYVGPVNAIAEEGAGTISVRYIEVV